MVSRFHFRPWISLSLCTDSYSVCKLKKMTVLYYSDYKMTTDGNQKMSGMKNLVPCMQSLHIHMQISVYRDYNYNDL